MDWLDYDSTKGLGLNDFNLPGKKNRWRTSQGPFLCWLRSRVIVLKLPQGEKFHSTPMFASRSLFCSGKLPLFFLQLRFSFLFQCICPWNVRFLFLACAEEDWSGLQHSPHSSGLEATHKLQRHHSTGAERATECSHSSGFSTDTVVLVSWTLELKRGFEPTLTSDGLLADITRPQPPPHSSLGPSLSSVSAKLSYIWPLVKLKSQPSGLLISPLTL